MLAEALKAGLEQDAYAVDHVATATDALTALASHTYSCVVLDLTLPDGDGLTILTNLRRRGITTPTLIISARDALGGKVTGLDAGADDYLVKPFDLNELKARIRAVHRRGGGTAPLPTLVVGKLRLAPDTLQGWYDDQALDLSAKEFRILQTLAEARGRVVSREKLESALYSWGQEVESNAIEVHIHRIRKKTAKCLITTRRAAGYVLTEGDA